MLKLLSGLLAIIFAGTARRAGPDATPSPEVCPDCGEPESRNSRCGRCDDWVCDACIMEGLCGNCFAKAQGGVH